MAKMIEGLIAVMLGAILLFAVVVPLLSNAELGEVASETITNATAGATYTIVTVTHAPIRSDMTYVKAWNSTGTDLTSVMTVYNATAGKYTYTNASVIQEDAIRVDYRYLGGTYISGQTPRTIVSFLPAITIVLLLVGITSMLYINKA